MIFNINSTRFLTCVARVTCLVIIIIPVFISTLLISVKRDLPCFAECCCGPGGVFHHAYEGWSSAFCGAIICDEDETADDHTLSNTPSTSVECTLAPEDLDHQQLQALEIAEAKRACQLQLELARMQRLRMPSAGMLLMSLMCRMAYSVCPTRRHVVENGSVAGRMKETWRRVISS